MVAVPAAPTPVTTTRTRRASLRTTFSALTRAREDTDRRPVLVVVEHRNVELLRSRSSISKQRGAAMSSRLTPPNAGATSFTVSTILSTSFVARQMGNASTPAKFLEEHRLAFHHW